MQRAQVNVDSEITKIRKFIGKKIYTNFILHVSELLARLMKEKYHKILWQSTPESAAEIQKIRNKIAKGRKDDDLGLGLWIGIYSNAHLFDHLPPYKFFTAENLNKINFLRNVVAHPRKNQMLTITKVWPVYVSLVNIVQELGLKVHPECHKLCEACLEERAVKKLGFSDIALDPAKKIYLSLCNKCRAITNAIWKTKVEKEMNIFKEIFRIRCKFGHDLENSYKKYLEPKLRELGEPHFHIIGIPETKEEKRKRLAEERKRKKLMAGYEEFKKEAMHKVYLDETQKEIFKLLFSAVKEAIDKDPALKKTYRECAVDDCVSQLLPDWVKIMKIKKRNVLSAEELKTLTSESIEAAFFRRLSVGLSKKLEDRYGIFIEALAIYGGVEDLLDFSRPFFDALFVMWTGDIARLYDLFLEMFTPQTLDPKKLTKIVEMIMGQD